MDTVHIFTEEGHYLEGDHCAYSFQAVHYKEQIRRKDSIPPEVVSRRLGYARASTTLDI